MRKPTETRLRKRLKKLSQPHSGWLDVFPAIMGKADGTVLTAVPGVVWVRNILNGQVLAVHNSAVPNTPLLQVEVGKRVDQPGLWQIKGTMEPFSTPSTGGTGTPVREHHPSHEFPSSDTVWVDRKQIKHLTVLISDAANFIVKLLGGIMLTANGITKIATQTMALSSYVPTEGAVFVSIESDDDGVITVNEGTGFEVPGLATVDDIPSPAAGKYTRAYVLLYQGQSALSNNDIVVPMPPDFNPAAFSGSTHDHDSRYPRKWTGKTTAPTADDDSGDGYAVDDIWVDETNDAAYIAVDVTPTAAVWVEMGGGTFDLAAAIHSASEGTLALLDELPFWQNATGELRKTTYANLITVLQAYFNDIYAEFEHFHEYIPKAISSTDPTVDDDVSVGYEVPTIWINTTTDEVFVLTDSTDGAAVWVPVNGVTNGDSHDHNGGDGAQINHTTLSNIGTNTHAQIDTHVASTSNPHSVTAAQAVAIPQDGWIAGTGTWSYSSADDPTFVVSVPDADAALMQVYDRVKLTQTSAKYFTVTAKGTPSGGFTPVTIYGGSDYDLANAAITSPYFSHVKGPFGFPMSPAKWDLETVTTDSPAKASPSSTTWYGGALLSPTGPSLVVPIGAWYLSYEAIFGVTVTLGAAGGVGGRITLSDANNTEVDKEFTATGLATLAAGAVELRTPIAKGKLIVLTTKTTYYINVFVASSSYTALTLNPTGVYRNIIRARFAYL